MKRIIGLALLLVCQAHAQVWTGPKHKFQWNASGTPELVEGYRIYIKAEDGTLTAHEAGKALTLPLASLGLTSGRYEAWAIAYNPAGQSDRSNILPFMFAVPSDQIGAPQALQLIKEDPHVQTPPTP